MLILKLTDHNRQSHDNFQWPISGPVECDDWDPDPTCVGGLHGWAKGEGAYRHDDNDGEWLVVQVADALVVSLEGGDRVKFPKGEVVYCGTREGAVAILTASGSLSSGSDPAWACLTLDQCRDVAWRAADRAVRVYAPQMLRTRGHEAYALTLESLPEIVDRATALQAKVAARDAERAVGDAAYDAAHAAYAADLDDDAYAVHIGAATAALRARSAADDCRATAFAAAYADAAADAADLDDHANAAHAAAATAAYAADAAADACTDACAAAAARKAEKELCRMDKLDVLGVKILGWRS